MLNQAFAKIEELKKENLVLKDGWEKEKKESIKLKVENNILKNDLKRSEAKKNDQVT